MHLLMYVDNNGFLTEYFLSQWPYAKRAKTSDVDTTMTEVDRTYHDSMKPSWGPDGTLVYAAPPNAQTFGRSSRRSRERDGLIQIQKGAVVSQKRDIRFAKFSNEVSLCKRTFKQVSANQKIGFCHCPEEAPTNDRYQ